MADNRAVTIMRQSHPHDGGAVDIGYRKLDHNAWVEFLNFMTMASVKIVNKDLEIGVDSVDKDNILGGGTWRVKNERGEWADTTEGEATTLVQSTLSVAGLNVGFGGTGTASKPLLPWAYKIREEYQMD